MQSGKVIMKKIDDMINNVLDEVMSKATRMKKARMMKMKGKMIAKKRKIAMKRKASPEKLKSRAMKKARDIIAKIAKKILPKIRSAENERLAKKRGNE